MGGNSSSIETQTPQRVQQFNQNLFKIEGARIIVAVDFSLSNKANAKGWGSESLHSAGLITQNNTAKEVQSPYKRCLELLVKRIQQFDQNQGGFVFMTFTDQIKIEQNVTAQSMLHEYDRLAADFNNTEPNQIFQSKYGSDFSQVINRAIDLTAQNKEYTILIILTDGDFQKAQTSQAIIEASSFPLSICIIGIGESNFDELEYFDTQLFERKFDNLRFVKFDYTKQYKINDKIFFDPGKMITDQNSQLIFDMEVFGEIYQQWVEIGNMRSRELLEKITK
uniref:Copine I n=1 Tax=Trepomonas sp. PC1 TaxID=1076344 RepID=A0A146KJN8_9EUKA|eukprot:JAP95479.1 Copine I [Trepomonas sp. PC1]